MLGKRFKFEMKSRAKSILIVSAVIVIIGIIFSLLNNNNEYAGEVGEFLSGIVRAFSLMAISAASFYLVAQTINRFNKSFLGDEGYLLNTLPVKGTTHILADFLADIVQVIIGGVLLVFFYFMATLTNDDLRMEFFHDVDSAMKNYYHSGSSKLDVVMLFVAMAVTIVIIYLFFIWLIKLGISISKNLINSNSRSLPYAVSAITVVAGIVMSVITIYFSQKSKYNNIALMAMRSADTTLSNIEIQAVLTVLLVHVVMLLPVMIANIYIINKKLNLQ